MSRRAPTPADRHLLLQAAALALLPLLPRCAAQGCAPNRVLPAIPVRAHLGKLLKHLNYTGRGVELGVQAGIYTRVVLTEWQQCSTYVQVDLWHQQTNYVDGANAPDEEQKHFRYQARKQGNDMVRQGYAQRVVQCANYTTTCAERYPDSHFDFVYVDARHDYKGVYTDITTWWPKLREGGLMAGHDYTLNADPTARNGSDPHSTGQDWTLNFDGTRGETGRVVKGAVDDFFAGKPMRPGDGKEPPAANRAVLHGCPRQVQITYREPGWNLDGAEVRSEMYFSLLTSKIGVFTHIY